MVRETREEIGITPTVYQKMAEILFHNPSNDETLRNMRVHTYIATYWEGEITETNEMKKPKWFVIDDLDYEQFLSGDREFLPKVFGGIAVKGEIWYDENWQVERFKITSVETFS
jgi:8-oxo-dGTP pyrophosphatase MutT (NUDIX family)